MLELDLNALPFKHWLCDSNVISILPAAYMPGAAVCASLSRRLKCSCPAGVSAVYYNFFHSLRLLVKSAILICAHFTSGVTLLIIK